MLLHDKGGDGGIQTSAAELTALGAVFYAPELRAGNTEACPDTLPSRVTVVGRVAYDASPATALASVQDPAVPRTPVPTAPRSQPGFWQPRTG